MPDLHWQSSASLECLRQRAGLLTKLRQFFAGKGVMEVETPLLSCYANIDPALESFSLAYQGQDWFLQTSPEFAMKRLLASGCGPIYQLCKAFRKEESGRWHNPEFTLLEWYRPGFDHLSLMQEVQELILELLPALQLSEITRLSYNQAFLRYTGLHPLQASLCELQNYVKHAGITISGLGDNRDSWLQLLMSHCIEPQLKDFGAVFIYHFPASQAALARLNAQDERVADRFELYIEGIEIANGFYELSDAQEQKRRFIAENQMRKKNQQQILPYDSRLLAALESGLPDCAGVALGVDRLLMLLTGESHINRVIGFPIQNS